MLKKSLLVMGALVFYPVDSMDKSLIATLLPGQESDQAAAVITMESSHFFECYSSLHSFIEGRIGFSELEDPAPLGVSGPDAPPSLQERMIAIETDLSAICCGMVANYAIDDKNGEVDRLIREKFPSLKGTIAGFFRDLRDTLKTRRDSISGWSKFWHSEPRLRWQKFDDSLKMLNELSNFLERGDFRKLVKNCFLTAYDREELKGDDQLQEWHKIYKAYISSRRDTPRYFSQSVMAKCNENAMKFAADICLEKNTEDVNQWREEFLAINEFSLPTTRLSRCSATDATLMSHLEGVEGGFQLDIRSRGEIIGAWKNSIGGRRRFKGFVPVVSPEELSKFFFESGGTAYKKSVDDLLDQESDLLEATLWGALIGRPGSSKGLVLEALQVKNAGNSYLNTTLIISDLERLCTADEADRGKVDQIVSFLKCITDTSLDPAGSAPFRFSYLGFDDSRSRAGGVNLSQFNVLLSTPTMSFDDIIQGLTGIVGANSARALRDRMIFVAQKERVNPVNSDAQVQVDDLVHPSEVVTEI